MNGLLQQYRGVLFWTLLAILAVASAWVVGPFWPAILWASVLAVLVAPIDDRFRKRLNPTLSSLATTLLTLAIIGVPLILVGFAVSYQLGTFAQDIQGTGPATGFDLAAVVKRLDDTLKPVLGSVAPEFNLSAWFEANKTQIGSNLSAPLTRMAVSTGYGILTFVLAFLTLFFMLRDWRGLRQPTLELIPLPRERGELILARLANTIRGVFVAVVLVALAQGTVATITYAAVGIPNWLLWGVLTIILCTVPLVGAPVVYIPLCLTLLAEGKPVQALILAGVGFGVVSQIDNLIRPFVIGAQLSMHPMAVFFALLGGVLAFGPIGLMVGPMLLAVLLTCVEIAREKLNPENAPAT